MSDQPNNPLLSDQQINDTFMYGPLIKDAAHGYARGAKDTRDIYEAARAKDRELIQALVDTLEKTAMCCGCNSKGVDTMMELAAERGYKPTGE